MNSSICTLVEGDYHLGLGALANSLYLHGFRGTIWAGFRGSLPPWAVGVVAHDGWQEFAAAPDLAIRFVPLTTPAHLTNYKPQFMLDLWSRFAPEDEQLFYFDPDIVAKCRWSFFAEWAGYGVALVEDVNSPMPESHPRKAAWKSCLQKRGITLRRETSLYVNGGFVGLRRSDIGFLRQWQGAMDLVAQEIGGLEHSMFSFAQGRPELESPSSPFSKTDQDALNIALMTATEPLSIMGSEGMDFKPGGWTMAHALGPEKPWRKHYIRDAFKGASPSSADREFWRHARAPIAFLPSGITTRRQRALLVATVLSRFIRRN